MQEFISSTEVVPTRPPPPQRHQNPLIKEYTLNLIRVPNIILKVYSLIKACWSLWVHNMAKIQDEAIRRNAKGSSQIEGFRDNLSHDCKEPSSSVALKFLNTGSLNTEHKKLMSPKRPTLATMKLVQLKGSMTNPKP